MNKAIIVFGPQGCGKTRNKDLLAAHFGAADVRDGWDPEIDPIVYGSLHLTHIDPVVSDLPASVEVHRFDKAMAEIDGERECV